MGNGGIRWGVAGPGKIAARFVEAMELVDDAEIVAVASRSPERAGAFADRFGIARRHGDYAALAEDPDVDVVYVATPHVRHEADTLLYVEAGKHVLCEKPLAVNAAQARRMAGAARARGVFLMEALWSRFLPAYRMLAAVLAEGRIGELLTVEADFGFRSDEGPDHRLFARELGGGATLDLGIYPLQVCSLALGPPDRVRADGVIGPTGVDEQIAAVLHHPGGALGVVKAGLRVELACTARISGSDGWIDLPTRMHHPEWIRVGGRSVAGGSAAVERIDTPYDGNGLQYQAVEVHRCLAAGLTESTVMPLDESVSLATTLDAIRAQVGVVYPGEEPG